MVYLYEDIYSKLERDTIPLLFIYKHQPFFCQKHQQKITLAHDIITPYMAKLSSWKTFEVVHKIHYSLENFHSASGRGHHVLYTQQVIQGENFRNQLKNRENHESFPTRTFCHIR